MIWIFGVLLLASISVNIYLVIGGLRASDKIEIYEDFIIRLRQQVNYVVSTFELIDKGGHFEADDEVGDTFKALKETADSLSNFLDKE